MDTKSYTFKNMQNTILKNSNPRLVNNIIDQSEQKKWLALLKLVLKLDCWSALKNILNFPLN